MEVKAKLRYLHIAPRKVRLVIDLIRGLEAGEALQRLDFIQKRAARPVKKLLHSAISNAEHNFNLDRHNLYIKEIRADEGPKFKRWQPRAFGRAYPILKRTSHITIVLEEKVPGRKKVQEVSTKTLKPTPFPSKSRITKKVSPRAKPRPERKVISKIWDRTREAGHRHKQHKDKKKLEKQRGARGLKKFFQRKAV